MGTDLAALLAAAIPFRVRLGRSFRGVEHRDGLLLHGPSGWGEFSPFADYDQHRAARWLAAAYEAAAGGWPDPLRTEVPVNGIVAVADPSATAESVERLVRVGGCRTIKVKVAHPGESASDEFARVSAVRDVLDQHLGPGRGSIRLDANEGWSVAQALSRLEVLARAGIEYVEQPCASVTELARVKRAGICPVAADEAIRVHGHTTDVSDFADVAVLKVAPLGGVRATLDVAAGLDVPVVVSGSMDTSVGLAASAAAAAALPDLRHDCGLATGALLADDVCDPPTLPGHGVIPVARPEPDPELLDRARARLPADSRNRLLSLARAVAARVGGPVSP